MSKLSVGMKRAAAILLAIVGLAPLHSASADELLRDTFAGTKLSATWEAPASSVQISSGHVAFPGGQRTYVRSVKADWVAASFRAEITVTVSGDATGCGFFGLGEGAIGNDRSGNPSAAPSVFLLCGPSGFADGPLQLRVDGETQWSIQPGPGSGTHRLRLTWDAKTRNTFVEVDRAWKGGEFQRDDLLATATAPAGLIAGKSRLFFGGAGSARFSELVVNTVDAADLEALTKELLAKLEQQKHVVWDSPSKNALGSMPLGNGDIGANVWVEPTGDLVLLFAKTDAYDEFNRLLKLGRIRIKTSPNLAGQPFEQKLHLEEGSIEIKSGDIRARVWSDANHPVVQVDVDSPTPVSAEVVVELWRKAPRGLNFVSGSEKERNSAPYNRPDKFRVNADSVLPHTTSQLAWCHHNVESQWKANLELTALGDQIVKTIDPVLHRAFGAVVRAAGFNAVSDTVMKTETPVTSFSIQIYPLTKISDSPQAWLTAAEAQADGLPSDTAKRFAAHCDWWHKFWQRSWIKISGDQSAGIVTQAWALQRYVTACSGRGALPIKFNGSLFTVDQVFDADYRRWGGAYWWQNTRFPYWGMLSTGDFDLMLPLFKMYRAALPLREAATKKYYGHDGAFYPETMYFWGNYTDGNYGLNRQNKPDGLTDNTFIRYYWQGGLELVAMMLDYYDATQDTQFRDETLLPLAKSITTFFDQHWQRDADGKVLYTPAQSLETYHVATNPLPEIAGLHYLLPRLMQMPVDAATKAMWKKQWADQPDIPSITNAGQTRLLPGKKYSNLSNTENPELYAVFPYRLYTVMQDGDAHRIGVNTWKSRRHQDNVGWQQQPIQAALLGLKSEAKSLTVQRAKAKAAGYRFPGFYGPNYDWTPDQDQISVFMVGLQRMLMQCEGKRILLLPAWPKEWDVDFKLHAPYQTTVEGKVVAGKVTNLKVTPESRRNDVEFMTDER